VTDTLPTHLLYRSIAYPVTEKPLTIGREIGADNTGVHIYGRTDETCARHCTIERHGREIVLNDYSTHGTFVNGIRVNGSMALKLGQIIRLGTNGEQLQLIACLIHNSVLKNKDAIIE
jgi:pSer/pThr/pTyr-binding forkhead associated (FHA) protein